MKKIEILELNGKYTINLFEAPNKTDNHPFFTTQEYTNGKFMTMNFEKESDVDAMKDLIFKFITQKNHHQNQTS
jgi:hypothetical protein